MNKLSIEESLRLLAPTVNSDEESEPENNNFLEIKNATPPRSPVNLPKVSPLKNINNNYRINTIKNIDSEEEVDIANETDEEKNENEEEEEILITPQKKYHL